MITYYNLGANYGDRLIYIRSTYIEQKLWGHLLISFPDEGLYHLVRGTSVLIEDKSSGAGKVERIFCPAFSDFLRWLNKEPMVNNNVHQHTKMAIEAYKKSKLIQSKYKRFKGLGFKSTNVFGKTIRCDKEPSVW